MNNDLIKRYMYAVSCHLPMKLQPEVEMDLENMISELLDARCGEKEPTDADIREVLTELGSPEELAVKYSGEENKALISGIYLLWCKSLLKVVLPIVAVAVALITLFSAVVQTQSSGGFVFMAEQVGQALGEALNAAVQAFVWIVAIFAILEYKKVKFNDGDFLSKLRPVPDKRAQIKTHVPVINIFLLIAVAALFLGFSHLIGGYTERTGWVPTFDQSYIRGAWYFIVIGVALGVVREIYRLVERRYSKKLAVVTAITNGLAGITATLFLANDKIMNPGFGTFFDVLVNTNSEELGQFVPPVNLILLAVIVFALLLEMAVTTYRAFRYEKR